MQDMKIRIHSEEHSRMVQEKLFEMGYCWPAGGMCEVLYTDKPFLFTRDNCKITFANDSWYFDEKCVPEYVLQDGTFVPATRVEPLFNTTEKPPLGLRPKSVVDNLRIKEILEACTRYAEAGKKIPNEWLKELVKLNHITIVVEGI